MARTALTVAAAPRTALTIGAGTAATVDGHSFANNGRRQVVARNTTAGALTIQVPFGQLVDGKTVPAQVITVPAAAGGVPGTVVSGFFGPAYAQTDGSVWLNYPGGADAGLTVTVVEPASAG